MPALDLSGLLWVLVQLGLVIAAFPTALAGLLWGAWERVRRYRQFSRTRGRALLEAAASLVVVGITGYVAGTSDLDRETRDRLDALAPVAAVGALAVAYGVYRLAVRRITRRRR